MKKAFIVEYSVRTRVVVDYDESEEFVEGGDYYTLSEKVQNEIARKAANNILNDPEGYICDDQIMSVEEDDECPAGTYPED